MCSHRFHLMPPASPNSRLCAVVFLSPFAWHRVGMVSFWSSRICRLLQLLMVIAYLTFAVSIRSLMSLVPILPSFFHLIVLIIFLISLRRAFHWSSLFPSTSCMFPRCLMCSPCLVHLMVSGVSLTMSKPFAAHGLQTDSRRAIALSRWAILPEGRQPCDPQSSMSGDQCFSTTVSLLVMVLIIAR